MHNERLDPRAHLEYTKHLYILGLQAFARGLIPHIEKNILVKKMLHFSKRVLFLMKDIVPMNVSHIYLQVHQ